MADPFFKRFRLAEIADTMTLFRKVSPDACDLLEIGGGTGWQAKALSEAGYRVEAVDLPADNEISNHASRRVWPIRDYDGVHLPFGDDSFDIVYSSNVLEHVERLDALLAEIRRVLRPEGVAVHLVPNSQWRLISLASYYPGQAKDGLGWLARKLGARKNTAPAEAPQAQLRARRSFASKIKGRLLPFAHGSEGTAWSEIARFSGRNWRQLFDRNGWSIVDHHHNGITVSGDYLLGGLLPLGTRRMIGKLTGGIAHVLVMRPKAKR